MMRYYVTVEGGTVEVELGPDGIRVEGAAVSADLARVSGTALHSLLLDGASYRMVARKGEDRQWEIQVGAHRFRAEAVDERTRAIRDMTGAARAAEGPRPLRAPMPGMVMKIEVGVGDEVHAGDGLVVVEAMKMENELRAETPGRVKGIPVTEGEPVEKDQILMEFEPLTGSDAGTEGP